MARFRVSAPERADLVRILATSSERWGAAGRSRYAAILAAAMGAVAADPEGPMTRDRAERSPGLRGFQLRHVRRAHAKVGQPVHVLYYRSAESGVIETVSVLHERMDPSRHLL